MNIHQLFDLVSRGSSILSGLALAFFLTINPLGGSKAVTPSEREWVLPAAFSGQGAVTIGCQLWDVPGVTPYSSSNPDTGFAAGSFSPASFLAFIDGPHGSVTLTGASCGVSVDWRRFPLGSRPMD